MCSYFFVISLIVFRLSLFGIRCQHLNHKLNHGVQQVLHVELWVRVGHQTTILWEKTPNWFHCTKY